MFQLNPGKQGEPVSHKLLSAVTVQLFRSSLTRVAAA
jgi:hypothetical protein